MFQFVPQLEKVYEEGHRNYFHVTELKTCVIVADYLAQSEDIQVSVHVGD